MNWLIGCGQWWESRRVIRKPDLEEIKALIRTIDEKLEKAKSENKLTPQAVKELALINARISQLELYVGLKRDPKPAAVPGGAKIS